MNNAYLKFLEEFKEKIKKVEEKEPLICEKLLEDDLEMGAELDKLPL